MHKLQKYCSMIMILLVLTLSSCARGGFSFTMLQCLVNPKYDPSQGNISLPSFLIFFGFVLYVFIMSAEWVQSFFRMDCYFLTRGRQKCLAWILLRFFLWEACQIVLIKTVIDMVVLHSSLKWEWMNLISLEIFVLVSITEWMFFMFLMVLLHVPEKIILFLVLVGVIFATYFQKSGLLSVLLIYPPAGAWFHGILAAKISICLILYIITKKILTRYESVGECK